MRKLLTALVAVSRHRYGGACDVQHGRCRLGLWLARKRLRLARRLGLGSRPVYRRRHSGGCGRRHGGIAVLLRWLRLRLRPERVCPERLLRVSPRVERLLLGPRLSLTLVAG